MAIITLAIQIMAKSWDITKLALGLEISFNIQGQSYYWTKLISQKGLTVSFV